ncbi:hypothetical protein BY996DRAFT_4573115 [Phakopsora pachyrhizi]|uniref:THIF-type NAD/FAD binding fold domain-containing protein n=1 Tax=Phakopsora pachyrhizi TaxID=170000 RepID=A0AAV0AQZ9_PHAPC|nr:hypothetical protein BY996DRAFT_4573115 [Phakopsora pachyrhizi]CAH7671609.1 hypothetical protein PPACK8108_LOCUS6401 [Phakopsora pachyrhizi]
MAGNSNGLKLSSVLWIDGPIKLRSIALIGLISSGLTILTINSINSILNNQPWNRKVSRGKGKGSEGHRSGSEEQLEGTAKVHDEDLIAEQLTRHISFLGPQGNQTIRNSFIVVIGLGGVGSSVAISLVRGGIGRIRLIDFDQVTLSSLNRHATATREDVGIPKVKSCENLFRKISPWIRVESRVESFNLSNASELLEDDPDLILDCIDNITTKVDLLTYCKRNNLKVISALGAASKADPSRVQIADISCTFEDPLARSVRRRLRLNGIVDGIPVVYSTERPNENVRLLPLPEEEFKKGNVGELSTLEDFRVRILPVLGPLPAMFGHAMAAYVFTTLTYFPTQPLPIKNRTKLYRRMYNDLLAREYKVFGTITIPFTESDVGYIFEEVYRGRSTICPTVKVTSTPSLIRWDPNQDLKFENCVAMTREEAEIHQTEVLINRGDPVKVWGTETVELVNNRFDEELKL